MHASLNSTRRWKKMGKRNLRDALEMAVPILLMVVSLGTLILVEMLD